MIKTISSIIILLAMATCLHASDKLLVTTDLEYLGAFRVPKTQMGATYCADGLSYGGMVIAYRSPEGRPDAPNGSLYITGCRPEQKVAELAIPAVIDSSVVTDLNTASVLQNLSDITEGHRLDLEEDGSSDQMGNGAFIGGLLKYGTKLIGRATNKNSSASFVITCGITSSVSLFSGSKSL